MDAFMQALHPEVRARPSLLDSPELNGRRAVATWWSDFASLEHEVDVRPLDYEVSGDCVVVRGYLRERTAQGVSESQIYWLYEISDGLVTRVESHPSRQRALAAC
jgi:hypothetical protein